MEGVEFRQYLIRIAIINWLVNLFRSNPELCTYEGLMDELAKWLWSDTCALEGCENLMLEYPSNAFYCSRAHATKAWFERHPIYSWEYKQSPEYKDAQKAYNKTPERRAKRLAIQQTPEYKEYAKDYREANKEKARDYQRDYHRKPEVIEKEKERARKRAENRTSEQIEKRNARARARYARKKAEAKAEALS